MRSFPSVGSPPMKFRLFPALFLLLLSPSVLLAQGNVSMKIDVVAWGDTIGGLSFKSGKKEGAITAKAFTYSEPVNYSGPRILEIHKSGNAGAESATGGGTPEDKDHESIPLAFDEPEEGKVAPKTALAKELAKRREEDSTLVALVPLPSNARWVTVLLAPAGEGTYQGYVINDDPSKLPLGKLRVHNLSVHEIAMKFDGGQGAKMKPRDTFLVNAANGQSIYQLAYRKGEKWKVQENNVIPVRPDEQTQLVVLRSRNQFFLSADGASGGFLQTVTLRRSAN